ncbi:hypothetical protein EVAR_48822_1 [Eumeta japonica]|uniref:Uncharacterized protein n=1 Tax=Eumeta variegata TaxID=151549 RepID=A0A4C1Y3B5_EUMVA|nr:hypothetical protein EVAR_48822_1 [Eumeta japonica]
MWIRPKSDRDCRSRRVSSSCGPSDEGPFASCYEAGYETLQATGQILNHFRYGRYVEGTIALVLEKLRTAGDRLTLARKAVHAAGEGRCGRLKSSPADTDGGGRARTLFIYVLRDVVCENDLDK